MPHTTKPVLRFPIKLTRVQRELLAKMARTFADRLELDEPKQRSIVFTVPELKQLKKKLETKIQKPSTGQERRPLQAVLQAVDQAIRESEHLPPAHTVYQFKITLQGSNPPIWRRIQVKDCTLDELHEHIQLAMGWTNSHLHQFKIDERFYAAPEILGDGFDDDDDIDSATTKISDILPGTNKRFRFHYEYDFGDSWEHEILFEGILRAEPKVKYPLCLEGERACPPEDCGGIWGYYDLLEAMEGPKNARHEELLEWLGGPFDPEAFDASQATKAMRGGLPDWRSMGGW
jgi:hypothetical protein